MQISIRRVDNTAIVDVSGDIDLASSPEVRKALLHEVRDNRRPRVVLNLSEVRYIDSSGEQPWWKASKLLAISAPDSSWLD